MSERQAGYYWVRHWQFHGWHIGEKTLGGGWLLTGMAMPYDDDDMEAIGQRIPTPDEPWQCVPVEPARAMLDASWRECAVSSPQVYRAMLKAAPKP